jgi:hypothetical protein
MTLSAPDVLGGTSSGRPLFHGAEGRLTLAGLFAGHSRLAIRHTMPDHGLFGSRAAPSRPLSASTEPGTRLVLVFRAPYSMVEQYSRYLGHGLPCYSAPDGVFGEADPGEPWEQVPVLSLFLRDGAKAVHAWTIASPGLGLPIGTTATAGPRIPC